MKSPISKKGFTLIELLIVIAIIAVLAIAFVPTLLSAPAKGRDSARIADLQKIQKVLINGNLEGTAYPATGCVNETTFASFLTALGGTVPKDPQKTNVVSDCTGTYKYILKPAATGGTSSYSFGLYAHVELEKTANAKCDKALTGVIEKPAVADPAAVPAVAAEPAANLCYAILTQ